MDLMAHTMQSQQDEIHSLKLSVASLVVINLSGNLFIRGIREHINEKCEDLAAEFFKGKLDLSPQPSDIIFAQQVGINGKLKIKGKHVTLPCIMKVQCSPEFRRVAWSKKTLLKDQTDPDFHWKFFMNEHQPDIHKAAKKCYKKRVCQVYKENDHLPSDQKCIPRVIVDHLYINVELSPDPITPPTFKELYQLPHQVEIILRDLTIEYSQPLNVAGNTFQGYALAVDSFNEINFVYQKLKIEEKQVMHIMMACSIGIGKERQEWSCNDGEHNRGLEIQKVLAEGKNTDIAVFVVCWKAGANMGGKRFKCIQEVARKVVQKLKMKEELKGKGGMKNPSSPLGMDNQENF